nr:voltage-dependent anion channel-forming protein RSc3414-like [Nerophis lumbriciformis]
MFSINSPSEPKALGGNLARPRLWLRTVPALVSEPVLTRIWRRVAFFTVIAVIVEEAHRQEIIPDNVSFTPLPFTLIGLALSIFLGFRNNTSYDRFWEGRKLWGRLVNTSRSLTRQILTLIEPNGDDHKRNVYTLMGYVHALRLHLRAEKKLEELRPFVGDRSLTTLADIQGGCERIRATPIPFAYTVLMHRIVGLYCFGLSVGIVERVGPATPLVVALISYAFLALDAIGEEIENPFGFDDNDLPLSQLSRMIEINLRERLGEDDLPDPVTPVEHVLS